MKILLRLEELSQFLLGALVFHLMEFDWKFFWIFLLAPDISMLGYFIDSKWGGTLYNLFHHKGIAILLGCMGIILWQDDLIFWGIILFSHSSMDRFLGFGLKHLDSFHHTHLGNLGKHE